MRWAGGSTHPHPPALLPHRRSKGLPRPTPTGRASRALRPPDGRARFDPPTRLRVGAARPPKPGTFITDQKAVKVSGLAFLGSASGSRSGQKVLTNISDSLDILPHRRTVIKSRRRGSGRHTRYLGRKTRPASFSSFFSSSYSLVPPPTPSPSSTPPPPPFLPPSPTPPSFFFFIFLLLFFFFYHLFYFLTHKTSEISRFPGRKYSLN